MPKSTETKPDPKNQLAKIIQERIRQAIYAGEPPHKKTTRQGTPTSYL
jgi:hypothetical protein